MREIRPSGSEGGVTFQPPSLPLSLPVRTSVLEGRRLPAGRQVPRRPRTRSATAIFGDEDVNTGQAKRERGGSAGPGVSE